MIALLLATLVHATPPPPHPGANPHARSASALRSEALLGWERDEDELRATELDLEIPWTGWETGEPSAGWEEDDARSLEGDDPEAAWDAASGAERERDVGWGLEEEPFSSGSPRSPSRTRG